jgi:hypothetical protein
VARASDSLKALVEFHSLTILDAHKYLWTLTSLTINLLRLSQVKSTRETLVRDCYSNESFRRIYKQSVALLIKIDELGIDFESMKVIHIDEPNFVASFNEKS